MKLYVKLIDDELFDVDFIPFNDGYIGEALKTKITFDRQLFLESEIKVLTEVIAKMADKTSSEIVEISHHEKGWIENQSKHAIISYQKYAFDLSAL